MELAMTKPKQVQKPTKRELRHEYDFEDGGKLSQNYYDAVMPDHVKEAIAKRGKRKGESKK